MTNKLQNLLDSIEQPEHFSDEELQNLLDAIEHPELLSDEELQNLLDNPDTRLNYRLLSALKASLSFATLQSKLNEADSQSFSDEIDNEWEKLLTSGKTSPRNTTVHTSSQASPSSQAHSPASTPPAGMEGELLIRKPLRFGSFGRFRKVAAVAGVAIISLVAIATGITVKLRSDSNTASIAPSTELAQNHCKDTLPTTGLPEAASIPTEPILFENCPLEEILDSIKIRHNVAAQFRSENAKAIRLYFRWNPDRPLTEIIGLLNNFRQFSIEQSGDTLLIN